MTHEEILNMEAGREMDVLVAEKVMGLIPCNDWYLQDESMVGPVYLHNNCGIDHSQCYPMASPPKYSTNMGAAGDVLEMLRQSQAHPIEIYGDEWYDGGAWIVNLYDPFGHKIKHSAKEETSGPERKSPSLALAICRVALLAAMEKSDGK